MGPAFSDLSKWVIALRLLNAAGTVSALIAAALLSMAERGEAGDAGLQPAALKIGLYESEANAATYKGIHQAPLHAWLQRNRYEFDIIGDKQASDPALLAQFAAVITTSCYIVPDGACAGLSKYVANGGQLIWIDGPARCGNKGLLATLGVADASRYAPIGHASFTMLRTAHFVCAGVPNFAAQAVGNPAVKATGEVLASWSGSIAGRPPSKGGKEESFPAIVVTRTGKGRAILLNWILWLGQAPEMRALLANAVEYALAERLLAGASCVVRPVGCPGEVAQPEPLAFAARVIGRPDAAGKTVALRASLLDAQGKPQGRSATVTVPLKPSEKDDLAWAEAPMTLDTKALPDGEYRIAIEGAVDGTVLGGVRMAVTLNGEMAAKLLAAEAERARLLRPLFEGTLGDYDAEPRTRDGRVDVPRLLEQVEAAHMNTYDFLIWHAKTDWEDFQRFAPEAKKRGLKVWITLVPPSEPPPSAPFGLDYIRWADEIGKLSRKHDNILGVVIDDFWSDGNHSLFTPSYVGRFVATLRGHNPKLAFLPTIYWGTIGDTEFIQDYRASLDGIVFPYAELDSTRELPAQLTACRKWLGPHKLLLINVYATGSSGTGEKGPRTPEYLRSILTISRAMCDGMRVYCLPKGDSADYRFAITAELYGKWRRREAR